MYRKEDPRTIRTREMIKKAALVLLQEGYTVNDLTVQKVTQQASLNRTTFYLHYQDIPNLITGLTEEIIQGLSEKIDSLIQTQDISESKQLILLLDYLYNQRQHLLVLFKVEQFEGQLFLLMRRLISSRRDNIIKSPTKKYVDIDIKASSLVGIIMWWLKNGLHYSSEYIAEHIQILYKR